jgi:hypothetical protein
MEENTPAHHQIWANCKTHKFVRVLTVRERPFRALKWVLFERPNESHGGASVKDFAHNYYRYIDTQSLEGKVPPKWLLP